MSNRCNCQRCTIRGLMWPTIVVTVGVLFLLAQFRGGYFDFWGHTWPVILIVIGLINLASAFASTEGHDSSQPPAPVAPSAPAPPPPSPSPNPYEGQGQ